MGSTADAGGTTPRGFPTFNEFRADSGVLERIDDIRGFQYVVSYQNNGLLSRSDVRATLLVDGLSAVNDLLERTGIHRLHQVDTIVRKDDGLSATSNDEPLLQFVLRDDLFGCSIAVLESRFILTRNDSSLESFYAWYIAVMPLIDSLETTMRRIVERITDENLRVVSSLYEFQFYFTDFRSQSPARQGVASPPERRRNLDALQRLVESLPDEKGELREISKQSFLRLDLTLSRIETFSTAGRTYRRNTWYFLEAPSNEGGNYLVFRAQMRNTSLEIPDSGASLPPVVIPFDPDYADDHKTALFEFLQKRAFQGFVGRLFDSLDFATTRDL